MILGPSAEKIWPMAINVAYGLLWTAAALTVYTGLAYFRAGFAHLRRIQAPRRHRPGELA
jgi:phosphatidylglycerophosphate synthase